MPSRLPRAGAPLAAIDIGSNSFRLEIGRLQHERYRRIAYLKQTVRLGGGLDADGYLTEDAARRGLDCLAGFASRLAGFEAAQVRAVATQTLREARNRDAFLARAESALGYPIEVISGREEARLIYAGVAHMQPSAEPRLVIDIGGRSTEMILGRGRAVHAAESFGIGSVSLSMRWFGDGRFTNEAFRQAQIAAGAELEEALDVFSPKRWREALGSSGTAGAVSQLLLASGITDGRITPEGLRWCIARCVEAGSADRLGLPSLAADRKPIIGGGLSLLYTLVTHFGIEALYPAKGALRQGVIIDLHERHAAQRRADGTGDVRDASTAELQQRFGVDVDQAARVRTVATTLFAEALDQGGDDEALRELGWAADVHEIGQMVSHHDHHRHSAYLMGHVDAAGFSQSEQRRVADLVLAQRGGLRKIEAQLSSERFAWQALALRLAVIACHARAAVDPADWRLRREGSNAVLRFTPAWAARNPRTLHLLREEAGAWQRVELPRLLLEAA